MKSKLLLVMLLMAIFVTAIGVVGIASANPLRFGSTSRSATATTSPTYMTSGTATTTSPTLDAYVQPSGFALDRATLLVRMGASSTASILNINIEYSHDAVDWYEEGGTLVNGYATTSNPFYLTPVKNYVMNFASSTPGLGTLGSIGTTTRAIKVETPTRYVRAVFSIPVGASASNVWSEWVPIRETSEN